MSREDFERALAAYGADFRRWPPEIAERGRAKAAQDADAGRLLAEAEQLDRLLAQTVEPASIDAATVGRILSGISSRHERETTVRPTGRLLVWAGAAMAVFLVVGFVLGTALPATNDSDNALAALMFGSATGTSVDSGGLL
jgi:hypothetical protein